MTTNLQSVHALGMGAAVKQKNVHLHMAFFRRTVWVNGS